MAVLPWILGGLLIFGGGAAADGDGKEAAKSSMQHEMCQKHHAMKQTCEENPNSHEMKQKCKEMKKSESNTKQTCGEMKRDMGGHKHGGNPAADEEHTKRNDQDAALMDKCGSVKEQHQH